MFLTIKFWPSSKLLYGSKSKEESVHHRGYIFDPISLHETLSECLPLIKKASEYDQEIPQLHTADRPTVS